MDAVVLQLFIWSYYDCLMLAHHHYSANRAIRAQPSQQMNSTVMTSLPTTLEMNGMHRCVAGDGDGIFGDDETSKMKG